MTFLTLSPIYIQISNDVINSNIFKFQLLADHDQHMFKYDGFFQKVDPVNQH